MKKDNKIIDFYCEIYGFRIIVSFQNKYEKLEKSLQKKFPDGVFYQLEDTGEGRVIQYSNNIFLIWIREDTHETIAHEVFHCVHFMMDEIGCNLSEETKEPYAFLAGYLTKKIYELKNKK